MMHGRPRSLRRRLLGIVVLLLIGGLLVTEVVTYTQLRTFLYRRIDEQLAPIATVVVNALRDNGAQMSALGTPTQLHEMLPDGTYLQLRDNRNAVLGSAVAVAPDERPPVVTLPADLPIPTRPAPTTGHFGPAFTVGGTPSYRVVAAVLPGAQDVVLVGLPLNDVNDTLNRLAEIELAVAATVVLLGGGLAWWLVRLGLRPLTEITRTAGAISDGDLSLRVDRARPDSEVGRLGRTLNAMLDRIEAEIGERRAAEDRMRRFVADASHELRTPLSAIRACAELFRRGAAAHPDDLGQVVRRIEDEAARMGVLVADLLLLARLDAGQPLAAQPVDLTELARRAVDDARLLDPSRPLDIVGTAPALVHGDPHGLRRAVDNLLSNVRAHTPAGVRADIRVGRIGDQVCLAVADTGPGIPAEQASRVFDRFYRGDPGRSWDGGTGLGLSVVATIAKAHGGTVALSATPGRGATFTLRFPAIDQI
jgi:two-component system OmpR family sensor kinase